MQKSNSLTLNINLQMNHAQQGKLRNDTDTMLSARMLGRYFSIMIIFNVAIRNDYKFRNWHFNLGP